MKRFISITTAFCILSISLSCSQPRILTVNDVKTQGSNSDYIILHTPKRNYILDNYMFGGNSLNGNLKKFKSKNGYYIHVYSKLEINLKLNKDSMVPISLDYKEIKEMKYMKTVIGRNFLLTAGIVGGAILFVGLVELLTGQNVLFYNWGD